MGGRDLKMARIGRCRHLVCCHRAQLTQPRSGIVVKDTCIESRKAMGRDHETLRQHIAQIGDRPGQRDRQALRVNGADIGLSQILVPHTGRPEGLAFVRSGKAGQVGADGLCIQRMAIVKCHVCAQVEGKGSGIR